MVVRAAPGSAEAVLDQIEDGADLIVPLANGEPVSVLDALEANALTPGSMVTTPKNTVDHIVTEYGVADMRGRSISQRAAALIAIAHPAFRDGLAAEARTLGYL